MGFELMTYRLVVKPVVLNSKVTIFGTDKIYKFFIVHFNLKYITIWGYPIPSQRLRNILNLHECIFVKQFHYINNPTLNFTIILEIQKRLNWNCHFYPDLLKKNQKPTRHHNFKKLLNIKSDEFTITFISILHIQFFFSVLTLFKKWSIRYYSTSRFLFTSKTFLYVYSLITNPWILVINFWRCNTVNIFLITLN